VAGGRTKGGDRARGERGWQTFWRDRAEHPVGSALRGHPLQRLRHGEFARYRSCRAHPSVTNTLPLHVEILYNEYNFVGAFAVVSLLTLLALVTFTAKTLVEWRLRRD
jgi:sulfate transport system permease protein